MKNKIFFLAIISLLSNKIISQAIENVNPKGNWYFGAEIGTNKMSSFSVGGINQTFQGGVLAEYYFARHWSLSSRIKYFETGVSFYSPNTHTGSWFDLGSDASFGTFKGAVIVIPIDIKWEFRIDKNLGASLKLGFAHNIETKSDYSNYSDNLSTDYPKQYRSFNLGFGMIYFLSKKMAIYIDLENFVGQSKGYSNSLFSTTYYNVTNNLINFGIKYNFKKEKEIK